MDRPATETDRILEHLRPRMHAARVSHVRRMIALVATVPLLGVGAMAMAAPSGGPAQIETAVSVPEAPETLDDPDVALPEIGAAGGESGAPAEVPTEDDPPSTTEPQTTQAPTTTPEADGPRAVEVGALGMVELEELGDDAGDGSGYELLSHTLVDGWEVLDSDQIDGALVIIVGRGEVMKAITIRSGIRDELLVSIDEFVVPTTTLAPEPAPAPAPIVDRFVVEVGARGSFVVEREGETLYVGNVTVADGHEYEIVKGQGWKVYVGFFADGHVWYGKALINDQGEVEQHFWDEDLGPQPSYQWVEIPGVGAAKFEMLEGLVKVYKTETGEGFESWDHNQGAHVEVAKVDFEGNGQVWFIEAWVTESGELASTTYQGD